MTAPQRRRPLPAMAFIGALSLLTALVWFRVLHRSDTAASSAKTTPPSCTSSSTAPVAAPTVLPVAGKVSVLVLNSTSRSGLAAKASKVLRGRGFQVAKPADDTSTYGGHGPIKGVAEIRYSVPELPSATLLSYYFPRAVLRPTDGSGSTVFVSLGAAFHTIAKQGTVQGALRRDHVTLVHRAVRSAATPKASC